MSQPGWRQPLTWMLAGLAALPALVAAGVALTRDWVPVSDLALIELRLRDVGGVGTPLLGPFSRYGWNHPGPLMFWLLAPVYRALGSSPASMMTAGALCNAAFAVVVVLVARRFGGRQLAVLVALATCLLLGASGFAVADPWNPWLALLPFVLFLVTAAAVAGGDVVLVPLAVGVGSFLVQTHVGYTVLVGATGAWAGAWLLTRLWRGRDRSGTDVPTDRRRLLLIAGITVVVAAAAWSGPLVEQFTREPGNIGTVVRYFTGSSGPTAGWAEAASVVGRELHPLAPWLGGPEPTNMFSAALDRTSLLWALPVLAVFAAATAVAWRRRDQGPLQLAAVTWVGMVAGTFAVTRITGDAYFYLVRYWWALALGAWVTTAWVATRLVLDRLAATGRDVRRLGATTTVAIVVVALAATVGSVRAAEPRPPDRVVEAMTAIADDLVAGLEPGAIYRIESDGFSWFEVLFGVANVLDANGMHSVADRDFIYQFGERRVVGGPGVPDTVAGTLTVAIGDAVADRAADPRLELLASYDPLTPAERARLESLRSSIGDRLRAAGRDDLQPSLDTGGIAYLLAADQDLTAAVGVDIADARELTDLIVRGGRVAVFLDRSATAADGTGR